MKVIAFNGSAKADGNTFKSIEIISKKLKQENIEVEVIQVGKMNLSGCIGCGACAKVKNETCPMFKDQLTEIIQKAKEADGIILASPVYYSGVAGSMKCFLDRFFMVCGVNNNFLRGKIGASIATVRRTGGIPAVDELNHYIQYSEMIMPTSNYWTVVHGHKPGEISQDAEGVQIMEILGSNMAWLLKVMEKNTIPMPETPKKMWFNFIR